MRLRRAIPAGMADAGFASLAALAMGVYAARYFTAEELGIYSLFFTAFVTATLLPKQLVFVPVEVHALTYDGVSRLGVLPRALRLATAPIIVTSLCGAFIAATVAGTSNDSNVVPLAITMAVASAVSPAQDHVRRMLHLAGLSWHAAAVSVAQFLGIVGGLGVLTLAGVDDPWIPFGALALANICSLSYGFVVTSRFDSNSAKPKFTFRSLAKSGSWLIFVGIIPAVTAFIVAAIVVHFASAAAMGHAEAARIISRPILVVGVGLGAALRPRSMEAAAQRREAAARVVRKAFALTTVAVGGVYLAFAATQWNFNILADVVPNAYVVGGLVALSIIAATGEGVTRPYNFELTAARLEARLTSIEVVGNALRLVVVAVAAVLIGAFAVPLGLVTLGAVRFVAFRRSARQFYDGELTTTLPPSSPVFEPNHLSKHG